MEKFWWKVIEEKSLVLAEGYEEIYPFLVVSSAFSFYEGQKCIINHLET